MKVVKSNMALNPVSVNVENQNRTAKKPSFSGVNPMVTIMDSVDRGGYIASFIVQDGCGFIVPRVSTGLNRNREETGQYNWKFASTEAIREILSGPSMLIIPAGILYAVKKRFGRANDVPISHISALGNGFAEFAGKQPAQNLTNKEVLKKAFYSDTLENILKTVSNGELKGKELEEKVKYYTDKILEIEKAPKKSGMKSFLNVKVQGSAQDMMDDLGSEFVQLRKKFGGSMINPLNVEYSAADKNGKVAKVTTGFKKFFKHLGNYTDDAASTVVSKFKPSVGNVKEFVSQFNHKRISSRFSLILGMDLVVAAFLSVVPKLYKHKDGNPGLAGLIDENQAVDDTDNNQENKEAPEVKNNEKTEKEIAENKDSVDNNEQVENKQQPSFGSAQGLGGKLIEGGGLRKFANAIEYDGISMSPASLLGLFYFAVIGPRYAQAYDKYDRREILRRDLISLTVLTFMAQALSKGFSEILTKTSGFVLNHKPEGFNKIGKKIWNYLNPNSEFQTLKSDQVVAKYSQVDNFKNGIVDFCEYINQKGGNVKKVLSFDKGVKENVEKILKKPIKDANYDEIVNSFKKAEGSDTMKKIYEAFKSADNKFVRKAKSMNNVFAFLSTFLLTPALIVWIAKSNEKMTKRRIKEEQAQKVLQEQQNQVDMNQNIQK